jgi:hypothetical protein
MVAGHSGPPPHFSSGELTMKRTAASLLVFCVLFSVAGAAAVHKKTIQFARGASSTVMTNSVIRGDSDWYYISVSAGQTMEASISATENNAAFQIYKPGFKIVTDDGVMDVEGETLPGVGIEDDGTSFKGTLPVAGRYLFVVGGTRGNAEYKLKVSVH